MTIHDVRDDEFKSSFQRVSPTAKAKNSSLSFCPRKTPANPNHDKKRRNIPNVLSRVWRPRSEVIEPFELHSSIVRGGRSQRTASVGILEFPRITSNGRDQKTVSVETDSTPGIHPRVPRTSDELPVHIRRIAHTLRRIRRGFYHFRVREGPRAPPAGVLVAQARHSARCAHPPGTGCATPTHAARSRELAQLRP